MTNKPTVTIGIPAYNEEANIGYLLNELLGQKQEGYEIEKIIVASDGGNDKTNEIVSKFKSNGVKLIRGRLRKGAPARQNQIIKLCNSDILVLLNADIAVYDEHFLARLIAPIIKQGADLVSGSLIPIAPKTLTEKILYVSFFFKKSMYEKYNGGRNVYTCQGPARAFSKRLYKGFKFGNVTAEDAYSYFYCNMLGFKYFYAKEAQAYFKLPDNIRDHEKQSVRFFYSKKKFSHEFGKKFVEAEYKLPYISGILILMKYLFKHPINFTFYLFIVVLMRIKSFFAKGITGMWKISPSSKALRSEK